MTTRAPKSSVVVAGKTIYLNNKELLIAVKHSKEVGQMSNTLAMMLQLLCSKYAKKGNFINYSYNEDMQGYAMMMLVRTWNSFDPDKSNNPFAFFTQCIKNSFIQYLNQEKRQRDVRDVILIDQGMSPSFGFGESSGQASSNTDDEQNLDLSIDDIPDLTLPGNSVEEVPIERDSRGEEITKI